ncbi:Uncharacterized protein TCM_028711 isoform 2, partial [Theobroma cacao]
CKDETFKTKEWFRFFLIFFAGISRVFSSFRFLSLPFLKCRLVAFKAAPEVALFATS